MTTKFFLLLKIISSITIGLFQASASEIVHWSMDGEDNNTIKDQKRNINGEINSIGYYQWVEGKKGKAFEFSNDVGNNCIISLEKPEKISLEESFTVSFWMQKNQEIDPKRWSCLFMLQFDEQRIVIANNDQGGIRMSTILGHNQKAWRDTLSSLSTNEWHHLTLTYQADTGNLDLYLNGEHEAKIEIMIEEFIYKEATLCAFGSGNQINFHPFFGAMDEIQIFNEDLGEDEISSLSR